MCYNRRVRIVSISLDLIRKGENMGKLQIKKTVTLRKPCLHDLEVVARTLDHVADFATQAWVVSGVVCIATAALARGLTRQCRRIEAEMFDPSDDFVW